MTEADSGDEAGIKDNNVWTLSSRLAMTLLGYNME